MPASHRTPKLPHPWAAPARLDLLLTPKAKERFGNVAYVDDGQEVWIRDPACSTRLMRARVVAAMGTIARVASAERGIDTWFDIDEIVIEKNVALSGHGSRP